jgi:asparagine synthase (glutamine-hydrolysing)
MTKAKIDLVTAGWHTLGGVSVRGSAYRGSSLLGSKELCAAAQTVSNETEFSSFIEKLNGFFSIIIEKDGPVFAAVDLVRSIPLFYSVDNGTLYLSDLARTIRQRLKPVEASDVVRHEFLLTGYVTGRDTLAPGIKQLQSGEYVAFRNAQDWQTRRYFTFLSEARTNHRKTVLCDNLDRALIAAVERLSQWAKGRTIVVPLSGGYDSRLLVVLLKQIGCQNVLTYTYGRSESPEVKIALEVARCLGFACRFIEYSHDAWWRWFHSAERKAYFEAAHNLVSIPHIQDWPAVWHLRANELIPPDSVIVPGHTGDFLSGQHIPEAFWERSEIEKDDFLSQIYEDHYCLWSLNEHDRPYIGAIKGRIEAVSGVACLGPCSADVASGKYEAWEYQERQAKFIVNSVRVYDFWGYEWWLPYFDLDVVSFWLTVPYEWRLDARLYREYVVDKYARAANVSPKVASHRAPARRIDTLTVASAPYLAARKLYHMAFSKKSRKLRRRRYSYDKNSLAIFGIMDRETFNKYREEAANVHSFISKSVVEGDFF